MKKLLTLKALLILSLLISNITFADVPVNQLKEVKYLLAFVKNSDCIMNRNGSGHPAEKGASHIEKKYDYFRDEIKSTEDFIKYSATKSTMSGKYYTVMCPGNEVMKTRDWLLAELKQFRLEQ